MITLKTAKTDGGDGPLAPEVMAELAAKFQLSVFIETGTYLGNTTAAAVQFFKELHTIELSADLAQKAAQRFASIGKVHVHQGDSADRLEEILNRLSGAPLIRLDGHYSEGITARGSENTPVIAELQSIDRSGISNAVILIDDLRMFDARETKAGDPPSLAGYPSMQELHRLVASMQQKYTMYVYGDVALILPDSAGVQVSPLVQALTISRLYEGSNLTLDEVITAEESIAATRGPEREALRKLACSRSVRINEQYAQGLHYRYWDGLATMGENAAAAEQQFVTARQLGFAHCPVKWFLAYVSVTLGKLAEMQKYLTELLATNPRFAPAVAMLAEVGGSANIPLADASIARMLPSRSSSILSELEARRLWSPDKPLRLHLGCGEEIFSGYINIDYPSDEHNVMQVKADYTANITQLDFPPQSVDEIRLHHVFEHFNRVTALAMLIKWQQWLKIGGKLHIETPDLMGSAEILTADLPWQVKMGTVRHLAGDQAASWGYHVDHWFPERYQRTLRRLGFSDVNTQTSRWPDSPYLCNVQAIGIKTQTFGFDQLLAAADKLLWESTVAPAEKPTHAIWTQQLRAVLKNVHCGFKNIHIAKAWPMPTAPITNPAMVDSQLKTHTTPPYVLESEIPPLADTHDFNQRNRDC